MDVTLSAVSQVEKRDGVYVEHISQDGRWIALSDDETLIVRETDRQEAVTMMMTFETYINNAKFLTASTLAVTLGTTIVIVRVQDGALREINRLSGADLGHFLRVSPSGRRIFATSATRSRFLNVDEEGVITDMGPGPITWKAIFSHDADATWAVIGDSVMKLTDGEYVHRYDATSDAVQVFTPNGYLRTVDLAMIDETRMLRVTDTVCETDEVVKVRYMRIHKNQGARVWRVSSDGSKIIVFTYPVTDVSVKSMLRVYSCEKRLVYLGRIKQAPFSDIPEMFNSLTFTTMETGKKLCIYTMPQGAWSDRSHHLFDKRTKQNIFHLMTVKARMEAASDTIPPLPIELWLSIFEFLVNERTITLA